MSLLQFILPVSNLAIDDVTRFVTPDFNAKFSVNRHTAPTEDTIPQTPTAAWSKSWPILRHVDCGLQQHSDIRFEVSYQKREKKIPNSIIVINCDGKEECQVLFSMKTSKVTTILPL